VRSLCIIVGLLSIRLLFGEAEVFSRNTQLNPLALSRAQFQELVDRINHFVEAANQRDSFCKTHNVSIEASDEQTRLTFEASSIVEDIHRIPAVTTGLTINYTCYSETASISNLRLNLEDYRREVSVGGHQPDQVDALTSLIKSKLEACNVSSGPSFRANITTCIFTIFVTAGIVLLILPFTGRKTRFYWLSSPFIIVGFTSLNFLAGWLKPFFPGFAVYEGDVSIIHRYSVEIGLSLALLPILVSSVAFSIKRSKKAAGAKFIPGSNVKPTEASAPRSLDD